MFQSSIIASKKWSILAPVIIAIIIFDAIVDSNFYDIIGKRLANSWGIILYSATVLTSIGLGQYLFVGWINQVVKGLGINLSYYVISYRIAILAFYLLAGFQLTIVLQLILTSHYYLGLLIAVVAISMMSAGIIMGLFTYRLILWYKLNKRDPYDFAFLYCIRLGYNTSRT